MRILLHHWIRSLYFFTPQSLKTTVIRSAWVYATAFSLLLKHFYWVLLAEVFIFATLVESFNKQVPATTDGALTITPGFMMASFVLGILGLVLNTALLLFIRKEEPFSPAIPYFKYYFFRYLQFSLFIFAVTLFGLCMLFGMGITKIPPLPAAVTYGIKMLEVLAVLFWLDSSFSIKNIFVSFEKAINLLLYNLPIFAALLFMLWGIEQTVQAIILGTNSTNLASITLSQRIEISNLVKEGSSTTALVLFKYLRFIIEYFWIAIIFCVYRQRRDVNYAASFFDKEQEHE